MSVKRRNKRNRMLRDGETQCEELVNPIAGEW